MTGKARLRAKLCPVKFSDKFNDYVNSCIFTKEEMLVEDP